MDYELLLLSVEEGLATITLNRPESANAFNLQLSHELMQVAIQCDEDSDTRAVILTGAGRMFSAGGDMKAFAGAPNPAVLVKEMTTYLHAAVSRFSRMNAPLIVAVNGTAAGGGLSVALAGDIVLAAESAEFTSAYTSAALSPDGSSTYFLPRAIGVRRATEFFLTNRVLTAAQAAEWQLITRAVPDESLMEQAVSLGRELAAGPTLAYGRVKAMMLSTFTESLESQMEWEARHIADMMRTDDAREGMAAFVEKRQPHYRGR